MREEGTTPEPPEHGPPPTIWPLGFAIGIAVGLVGLIVDPEWVGSIGAIIAIVFGFLWAREGTAEMRHTVPSVKAEVREMTPAEAAAVPAAAPAVPQRYPRSRFLEGATLGLGGIIGGILTVPVAGFAVLPAFLGQKRHEVDMGPVTEFPVGKWFIATFTTDPQEGEVSRRTAFVRNNGALDGEQSFTIISNHCAHLGCPVQPTTVVPHRQIQYHDVTLIPLPSPPSGFSCPCHGGAYDIEGNRVAGPPVRALDRYSFSIRNGHLFIGSPFSVSHVVGTGATARIYKYTFSFPGEHVSGIESWLYPIQPPH